VFLEPPFLIWERFDEGLGRFLKSSFSRMFVDGGGYFCMTVRSFDTSEAGSPALPEWVDEARLVDLSTLLRSQVGVDPSGRRSESCDVLSGFMQFEYGHAVDPDD
jgi:hypothetical protein